ncbi:hypothetical protein PIB30_096766 [Stylosanthes scabra]|uniref:Uncharacterized protein n=1 Tax=Stylosanthes scabra TaxID=79078 RepID=A0ABU6WYT0_9FABA|nr:hypothetical protein [Stylosanthes scabra]
MTHFLRLSALVITKTHKDTASRVSGFRACLVTIKVKVLTIRGDTCLQTIILFPSSGVPGLIRCFRKDVYPTSSRRGLVLLDLIGDQSWLAHYENSEPVARAATGRLSGAPRGPPEKRLRGSTSAEYLRSIFDPKYHAVEILDLRGIGMPDSGLRICP